MSNTLLISQETAQWTLRQFNLNGTYPEPSKGVRGLMIAAAHLEGRALSRLDLLFPEIVAAVDLTKTPEGVEVLRAIAANGVTG